MLMSLLTLTHTGLQMAIWEIEEVEDTEPADSIHTAMAEAAYFDL